MLHERTRRGVLCLCLLLCGLPGASFAQDGNWNVTNRALGDFAGWATRGSVRSLVGDFDGDGRDDIALLRQEDGWNSMPVAFAVGVGNWTVTNGGIGRFAEWATRSDVRPLIGDFNDDGRDDVALLRTGGDWTTLPVAFATGDGNWSISNRSVGPFAGWARQDDVRPLVGDVDGDGRDDIALVRQSGDWSTLPVAFAAGSGDWSITNGVAGVFAGWARSGFVRPLIGDFDGDGRDDIALLRQESGWDTLPVASAAGRGEWAVTNRPAGPFAGWATRSGVKPLTGDFDGDGRDDIALLRQDAGWDTLPVAFAAGSGSWTIVNGSIGRFADLATRGRVRPLVGDFNGDGRSDIALLRQEGDWRSMPVALANGSGRWTVANFTSGPFAEWARAGSVQSLVGDFDADGRDDVALLRRSPGWNTAPVAFASDILVRTDRRLTVSRHSRARLTDLRADEILADASSVLQTDEGARDVSCAVRMVRRGDVTVFDDGDGSVDSQQELAEVFDLPGSAKVVFALNICSGGFNSSVLGCAFVPGDSIVVERFAANQAARDQEGILWAHEFGHNQGLDHRDTTNDDTVMASTIGANRRRLNRAECDAFHVAEGRQASRAASVRSVESAALAPVTIAAPEPDVAGANPPKDTEQTSGRLPVEEFVTRIRFEGLPLDDAAAYGDAAIEPLLKMLSDASLTLYHENVALTLGMIGNEAAVEPLIDYLGSGSLKGASAEVDADTAHAMYQGRVGAIMGLGYLARLSGSDAADDFLLRHSDPNAWPDEALASSRTAIPDVEGYLSGYAIIALGFSGSDAAVDHLSKLRQDIAQGDAGEFLAEQEDEVANGLAIAEQVSETGLVEYYSSSD